MLLTVLRKNKTRFDVLFTTFSHSEEKTSIFKSAPIWHAIYQIRSEFYVESNERIIYTPAIHLNSKFFVWQIQLYNWLKITSSSFFLK